MNEITLPQFVLDFFKQFTTNVYRPTKEVKKDVNAPIFEWFASQNIDFTRSRAILTILKHTNFTNPIKWPRCRVCGTLIPIKTIISNRDKLAQYCCVNCVHKDVEYRSEVARQNNLEKYGVIHPMQLKEVQEKRAQKCIDLYGTAYPMQLPEIQAKQHAIMKEKYGVEHYAQSTDCQKKARKTCLEKYGVDWFSKTQEFKDKVANTNIENFGVKTPLMLSTARNNMLAKQKEMYNDPDFLKHIRTLKRRRFYDTNKQQLLKKKISIITSRDDYYIDDEVVYQCDVCGTVWTSPLTNAQNVYCPTCHLSKQSHKELELYNYVNAKSNSVNRNIRGIIGKRELDILVDNKNAFEFNGSYWHSTLMIDDIYYHMRKSQQCQDKNIDLMHVFEYDWDHKRELVLRYIDRFLKGAINVIDVNQCTVKDLATQDAQIFVNTNTIDIWPSVDDAKGIYFEDQLISICYKHNDCWYYCECVDYHIHNALTLINLLNIDGFAVNWGYINLNEFDNFVVDHYVDPQYQLVKNSRIVKENDDHSRMIYNSGYPVLIIK